MLKLTGQILQLAEWIGLRVVVVSFFICVKNIIASTELWVDVDFEMIAVEVKGMDINIPAKL
jgi:TATA-box binding protein (TBP) (component of TFIID and TFIIIB)